MTKIGKLYEYTCVWGTGIYPECPQGHKQFSVAKLRQHDMFVLLEHVENHPDDHYAGEKLKILTTSGVVGWVEISKSYFKQTDREISLDNCLDA